MEKNKMMLIVIIVLLVILLGAIVGGGIYAYNAITSANGGEETEVEEVVDKSKNTLIPIGDAIYTNLLVGEDQKEHLAKVNLSLDVKGEEDGSEKLVLDINNRIVVVRDIVNNVLRKKTYEELKQVDGVENFKDEVLDKIRKEFDSNLVSSVYVNEIVLQ